MSISCKLADAAPMVPRDLSAHRHTIADGIDADAGDDDDDGFGVQWVRR